MSDSIDITKYHLSNSQTPIHEFLSAHYKK